MFNRNDEEDEQNETPKWESKNGKTSNGKDIFKDRNCRGQEIGMFMKWTPEKWN